MDVVTDLRAQQADLTRTIEAISAEITSLTSEIHAAYVEKVDFPSIFALEQDRSKAEKSKHTLQSQVNALDARARNVERYGLQALNWA